MIPKEAQRTVDCGTFTLPVGKVLLWKKILEWSTSCCRVISHDGSWVNRHMVAGGAFAQTHHWCSEHQGPVGKFLSFFLFWDHPLLSPPFLTRSVFLLSPWRSFYLEFNQTHLTKLDNLLPWSLPYFFLSFFPPGCLTLKKWYLLCFSPCISRNIPPSRSAIYQTSL